MRGRPRRRDYDLLRVASMVGVVYLHTAADALRQTGNPALWHFSNLLASLFTAAVPLFFMLSGALVLESKKTADPLFVLRRRLPRVAVPGIAWSLLVIAGIWAAEGGEAAFPKLLALPHTTVITPYWFLYALIPLYLLSPFLKVLTDRMDERHWAYFLLLWVLVTLGFHTLRYFVPAPWYSLITENLTLTVSLLEGYLGYFLLGAFLERYRRSPSRRVLWIVGLADWAVIALGTWRFTASRGFYGEWFSSYKGVFAMVLAACAFLLAKSYWGEGKGSGRVLTMLSACSFGVYLSHPLALKVVEGLFAPLSGGILGQTAVWLVTTALCVLGVILAGSVKPLCFLVTGQSFQTACRESNLFALLRKKQPPEPQPPRRA